MPPRPLAIALVLAASLSLGLPARADDQAMCRLYGTGEKKVILLIDRTSKLREPAKQAIRAATKAALAATRDGDRLDIATMSDSAVNRRTLFSDCRPGRKVGLLDRPLNREELRHYGAAFVAEVESKVEASIARASTTRSSALVDTIASLKNLYPEGSIHTLIIASDLLDNTTFNLPKGPVDSFSRRELLQNVERQGSFAQLRGAQVVVFGFGVDDELGVKLEQERRRDIENLWRDYFVRSKADDFKTILGY